MKDFYISNDFFWTIMIRFALTFYMQDSSYSEITKFKTWLLENNLPKMVENVEDKYQGSFKII